MAELLLRPANDSIRPISTVELALKVRPANADARRFVLDPQYEQWRLQHFASERLYICPLGAYNQLVRPADAPLSMEALDATLRRDAALAGGYMLETAGRWWPRTAMFVVGSSGCRALLEFLFRWG
jgi:hypothetical protein